ncbi:Phospholipase_D-nuclease N-terminal [Rubrobacter radiotolerans]|uniref:PLD nuclease N-terminal domain-containing protein n=1 Tax=Rubrobacter radiotolerans TaxID=42256 RepID=A0A023X6X5_RUBRA|nr:PLD nuclease N-terminal domain-containing protein [Rubrobacter radiotolerans]AHY47966.1 Phospholipase_D-nuclease N-terminal [Rubrobacter radiotolerans]MDX5892604.1 PLD nuclease N-terminal domain-containing protein [Rubrobacter radiotolerans]SMC07912.1 Phospholipase_D-nuclease N-terminal [Rubrobacter radiotolerans DSM 5868]
MPNAGWNNLGPTEKLLVIGLGLVQVALLVAALTDLYRRPVEKVRGWKLPWVAVSFLNFVGPISYFLFGRKR